LGEYSHNRRRWDIQCASEEKTEREAASIKELFALYSAALGWVYERPSAPRTRKDYDLMYRMIVDQ